MRTSAAGIARLTREEGLRLRPYNDSAGHATIGVGHLIHTGPVTAADHRRFRGFTRAKALVKLRRDLADTEREVERVVRVQLNQNEFDALVSLAFNIGLGAFVSSTLVRALNQGRRRAAADQFLRWWRGGAGLAARRRRERAVFLKPPPDPLRDLTPTERRWCREYDRLRTTRRNLARRRALRAAMTRRRKQVWRAAQRDGWSRANRRKRYTALLARTV